jgi:hypothetical protein
VGEDRQAALYVEYIRAMDLRPGILAEGRGYACDGAWRQSLLSEGDAWCNASDVMRLRLGGDGSAGLFAVAASPWLQRRPRGVPKAVRLDVVYVVYSGCAT